MASPLTTNTTVLNGAVSIVSNNTRNTVTLAATITTSGSVFTNVIGVNTGSWQSVATGSNKDLRFGVFANNDITSSILIGINTTASYFTLQPGDDNIYSYSGSAQIWAYGSGSDGTPTLNYALVSRN